MQRAIGMICGKKIFSKRQQGAGTLMFSAGFGNGDKTNLAFPTGRMKANYYHDLQDTHLIPFGEALEVHFGFFIRTMLLFVLQTSPGNGFCRIAYT